jgi:phage host-nuclease inhibitor protein Gam
MHEFERLGYFYLGRRYDLDHRKTLAEPILYDSRDLTTHAVCVGMTGSGKTGLCIALLEEAAIDGIPAIAIDPKGDLGNLLLTFPDLSEHDFQPWIDAAEAARSGRTLDEQALVLAKAWRDGLAEWGQDGARIARLRSAVDAAIYTPASRAGRPLAVLASLAAPAAELLGDAEAIAERVDATAGSLLALLGIDADPLRSREHVLLSTILTDAWNDGAALTLADLIHRVQDPPFDRVGTFVLESFYPRKDRFDLALALNNLTASPRFALWSEGEPLDVERLLFTTEGKPRLSIISIAHLEERERMFLVSLLLNEVVSWVRRQSGSPSLRAILYMDEVFGYLPPTAAPPSKKPLLTLLKQARAHGLGVVLATQNPVDLDYKALSNAGTWFLGRLQTERDKTRVLDGLESLAGGNAMSRVDLDKALSSLDKRVFLMHDVHEDVPVVFHTRWALSYLAGPLTREQIARLEHAAGASTAATPATAVSGSARAPASGSRPVVPPGIEEVFFAAAATASAPANLVYRPALFGRATVHYVNAKAGLDEWRTVSLLGGLEPDTGAWSMAADLPAAIETTATPPTATAAFLPLPDLAARVASYRAWSRALESHLKQERTLKVWRSARIGVYSRTGESRGEFVRRVAEQARAARDEAVAKMETKYAPKVAALIERIRRAEQRVDREHEQYRAEQTQTAISIGTTILGTLFGRRSRSSATTAMRGAGRAVQQKADVDRAREDVASLQAQLQALESELHDEIARVAAEYEQPDVEEIAVAPRKSDITVDRVALAWVPCVANEEGRIVDATA